MRNILISAAAICLLPMAAAAQDVDPDKLEDLSQAQQDQKKIEDEIAGKRDKIRSELSTLKTELTALSTEIKKLEAEQTELSVQVENLSDQKLAIETGILKNKSALQSLLAALQRMEYNPPPALATSPGDAANALRAAKLVSSISRQADQKVKILKQELIVLEEVRAELDAKQVELDLNTEELNRKKGRLEAKVSERNTLERSLSKDFDAARKRSTQLAKEAKTLKELIEKLEDTTRDVIPRIKPDPNKVETSPPATTSRPSRDFIPDGDDLSFAQSRGNVRAPVLGTISKRYSSSHPGLSVSVASQASVTAPSAGRVEFAGPFKNYDKVVILNAGDGYFILLTGLAQIYVQNGAKVNAGEPIGQMPSEKGSKLYLEVRKNGSTTNPSPWFGTAFAKQTNG